MTGSDDGLARQQVAELAQLLHETSIRHGSFEAVAPPHNWWDWYAAYLAARQGGAAPEVAVAAADRYLAEVKGVVLPPDVAAARQAKT